MKRLLIFSDLHREFLVTSRREQNFPTLPDPDTYDIVIAAGDIDTGTKGARWLLESFPNKPIVYVPGNHEFYNHDINEVNAALEALHREHDDFYFLNPGAVVINGIVFIGACVWSDLKLKGYNDLMDYEVERSIADFRVIKNGNRRFTAEDMRALNKLHTEYIDMELAHLKRVKPVVITHFVPTQLCISPRFQNDPLNPYFTNDLDELMGDYEYPLHIFGHTHDRFDIEHPYGTRVISNPLGYPGEHNDTYEWKIVTI